MKTHVVFYMLLASLFLMGSSNAVSPNEIIARDITLCGSSIQRANLNPFAFNFVSTAAPLKRKNVYSLTATEINAIKTGVAAMKDLPYNDPTSWIYQAAIHGTNRRENLPSWNTCHQSGDEYFFLAWHRMYVYFFERILRSKSGDPNLTLPYWDYTTNAALHPDYRNNNPSNPLFDVRSGSLNGGGSLAIPGVATSIVNALANIPYYDFQSDINSPHGAVHVAIGGNMGSVRTAALDPVFWLHHTNIDRLWEDWLKKCQGRANPTDAQWLNKSYTFFDESGNAISLTGAQVVNTAAQLNYIYDVPLKLCNVRPPRLFVYKRWKCIISPKAYQISQRALKINFSESKDNQLQSFIKENQRPQFNFEDRERPDKLIIELAGFEIGTTPEGVIEVYLNLPANEKPSPKSKSFVGVLDLFTAAHHSAHDGERGGIALNATQAAKELKLKPADLQKSEVTFFVRGNSLNGREVETKSDIKFSSIGFSVDLANQ